LQWCDEAGQASQIITHHLCQGKKSDLLRHSSEMAVLVL
jgi:hypothetical protein